MNTPSIFFVNHQQFRLFGKGDIAIEFDVSVKMYRHFNLGSRLVLQLAVLQGVLSCVKSHSDEVQDAISIPVWFSDLNIPAVASWLRP